VLILGSGTINVLATQVDAAGNVQTADASTASFVLALEVTDTEPPEAPLLAVVPDAEEATLDEAVAGAVTVTGEEGSVITVVFTNAEDETATVSIELTGDGTEQVVELTEEEVLILGSGTINVLATQVDAAGNVQTADASTASFVLALEVADTQAPVFTAQLDKSYKVGDTVNLVLPDAVNPDEELTYFAVDLTGNLEAMGLALDAETGAITGTVTAPSERDPALYGSWVSVTMTDLAGNESIDEFQISVFDQTKTSASSYTLNTDYFASNNTNPQVFKYPGTDLAQTVTLTQSYRDVIELAGGNDTVNLNGSDFGMNSDGDSGRMNFARLDGGDAPVSVTSSVAGDKIVFKFAGDTEFDLGLFNRPGDSQGQVLVNFETIDASQATANVNLTVTPLDLFLQGSDFLDANSVIGDGNVSPPTLVFKGTDADTLTLPTIDEDPTDSRDQDFVQIGDDGAWDVSGKELAIPSLTAGYTKLQGEVFAEGAVHYVELLFSAAITNIVTDLDLARTYPVIG
jgi:hypothetical protein